MPSISIQTLKLNNFLQRNRERTKALSGDLKTAHKAAAVVLHQWIQQNFEAEGGKHDQSRYKWKPSKRAIRENGMTLQDKGNLRRNWDIKSNSRKGWVKSKVSYSGDHEDGLDGLPQRKIFPTVKQGVKIIKPTYEKFIRKEVIK